MSRSARFSFFPMTENRFQPKRLFADQSGIVPNPVAATLFLGLILIVLIYSAIEQSGAFARMGSFRLVLPFIVVLGLMVGIYKALNWLKHHTAHVRPKGPLYMRSLMEECLYETCGRLEARLNTPEVSSSMVLDEILLDKMLHICATDCQRFSDVRRKIQGSQLKGTDHLELAYLFMTPVEYHKHPLPDAIQHVSDAVGRSRMDLKHALMRVKDAHQNLCTSAGDILTLLPPDSKKVESMRTTYRYRPPSVEQARRMVFALETLSYLKATRFENVNPMDRKRYDKVASLTIPKIAEGLRVYRQTWQDLVDAYERPPSERMLTAS